MKYYTPVLSEDRSFCTVGDVTLKVGESTEYKSCVEQRPSVGRIEEFKYAGWKQEDKTSVWMRVTDMGKEKVSEWISVINWRTHYDRGLFKAQKSKEVKVDSTESTPARDLPF